MPPPRPTQNCRLFIHTRPRLSVSTVTCHAVSRNTSVRTYLLQYRYSYCMNRRSYWSSLPCGRHSAWKIRHAGVFWPHLEQVNADEGRPSSSATQKYSGSANPTFSAGTPDESWRKTVAPPTRRHRSEYTIRMCQAIAPHVPRLS